MAAMEAEVDTDLIKVESAEANKDIELVEISGSTYFAKMLI